MVAENDNIMRIGKYPLRLLVYDEFKEGYTYNNRLKTKFGTAVCETITKDLKINGIAMLVTGKFTYGMRSVSNDVYIICDLIEVVPHAFEPIRLMMADSGLHPEPIFVEDRAAIIFLSSFYRPNSALIGTGAICNSIIANRIIENDEKMEKAQKRYREYQAFNRGKVVHMPKQTDIEFNRHSDLL